MDPTEPERFGKCVESHTAAVRGEGKDKRDTATGYPCEQVKAVEPTRSSSTIGTPRMPHEHTQPTLTASNHGAPAPAHTTAITTSAVAVRPTSSPRLSQPQWPPHSQQAQPISVMPISSVHDRVPAGISSPPPRVTPSAARLPPQRPENLHGGAQSASKSRTALNMSHSSVLARPTKTRGRSNRSASKPRRDV